MEIKKYKAFSLIEISMVIVIIGILIAGISTGIDLYNDARISKAQSLTKSSKVPRIPDLILWLDSVSLESFTKKMVQDEKIANWKDINPFSVSKLEGYQTSDNFKPTYNYNSISGLPAVKFNSTCMRVDIDIYYLQRPNITVFAVFKINGNNALNGLWGNPLFGNDSVGWGRFLILIKGSVLNNMAISNGNGTFTKTFNTTLNNPYQLTYVSQQSVTNGSYLRRNGVSSSPHTETFQFLQNSWINLGSDGSGTSGGCDLLSNFDLGEFIIYDRKLSDKEIFDVENYLNKKWEIR
jgi:prepilin-type N-terminal cleavage/methylation domain-containing protein